MALLYVLSALSAFPLIHAHMQMINPSPFRDPQANRPNEPKDYNILTPLHGDGSDFACKGYQWNTPWTTVATYEAGKTYNMELKGGATHGGGSCQLSMSFDGGINFRVVKSIVGGCPEQKKYNFTVPEELGKGLGKKRATGLFAWTWFNRIGNREMYMNCAVVDIVPKGGSKREIEDVHSIELDARDVARANAAAQRALASYPPLFVANIAGVNDCVTKETFDVVFDDPGRSVAFADGESGSAKPSFKKGVCIGSGSKSAGSSSSSQGSSSGGGNGQWQGPSSSSGKCDLSDGQYHPECSGGWNNQQAVTSTGMSGMGMGQAKPAQQASQQVANDETPQDVRTGKKPSGKVQKELDAYLATLYGSKAPGQKRNAPLTVQVGTIAPEAKSVGCDGPAASAQHYDALVPSAKDTSDQAPSRYHGDTTTPEALAQEFADIAGEDGPNNYGFDELSYTPEHYENYDDLYFATRSAAACRHVKRITARCASPNRWIKRGACEWTCARKGRAIDEGQRTQRIEAKLIALEKKMATLVHLVEKNKSAVKFLTEKKKHSTRLHRREVDSSVPAPTSLDLFLVYLDQLQDKVIECIRNIAAIVPMDRVASPADTIEAPTPSPAPAQLENLPDNLPPEGFTYQPSPEVDTPTKQKRQLVVPDIASLPPFDWTIILGVEDNSFAKEPTLPLPTPDELPWASADPKPDVPLTTPFDNNDKDKTGSDFTPGDVTPAGSAQAAWLAELARKAHVASSIPSPIPNLDNTLVLSSTATPSTSSPSALPSTPLQQWTDSLLAASQQNNPPGDPISPAAAAFPYLMAPGPVVPPGISIDWPGPNHPGEGDLYQPGTGNLEKMPKLVDDFGPGSEEEVRKWFEDIEKKYGADGSSDGGVDGE